MTTELHAAERAMPTRPSWDDSRWPTPAEWRDWFLAQTEEAQITVAARTVERAMRSSDCFLHDHVGTIGRLRAELLATAPPARRGCKCGMPNCSDPAPEVTP